MTSNIYPFFWLHGKNRNKILPELEAVKRAGINGLCVESRGHTSFGSEDWFKDMDIVMDFARNNGMKVWLLDDARFPTGYANGAFKLAENKGKGKKTLKYDIIYDVGGGVRYFDVTTFYNFPYFNISGSLEALVLAERGEARGEFKSFKNVTSSLQENGLVKLELKRGRYALIVISAQEGGGREDYVNLLDEESVDVLINSVYQPHYSRYKEDFGKTFCGFFSDEPELGNFSSKAGLGDYRLEDKIGNDIPLPFSAGLKKRLQRLWGSSYEVNLAHLWFGEAVVRSQFMEELTWLVKNNFSCRIGDWCSERGVEYVGHVIEDQNAHARLSAGAGHYFRSTFGMTYAGIDVVLNQILPDEHDDTGGIVFGGKADREFYSYALAPLGASFARIHKRKQGRSMCEIFGAYGWSEGTSLMTYVANVMLSSGINTFVPHAFSDADFPDFDCPPHFYAEGKNPQFEHFTQLIGYMDRVSSLIKGGTSHSKCAVLYHAESEWCGGTQLMQTVAKQLTNMQVAFDIVPLEAFFDADNYCLPQYRYLFVPSNLFNAEGYRDKIAQIKLNNSLQVLDYEQFSVAKELGLLERAVEGVRAYPYTKDGVERLIVFNSTHSEVEVTPKNALPFTEYNALGNCHCNLPRTVTLGARELKVLVFDKNAVNLPSSRLVSTEVDTVYTVSMFNPATFSFDVIRQGRELGDLNVGALDRYAGMYRYQFEVSLPANAVELDLGEVLDSVELSVNGKGLGARFAPPFRYNVEQFAGQTVSVQADVFTTLARAVRDPFSRYRSLTPYGIMGRVTVKSEVRH